MTDDRLDPRRVHHAMVAMLFDPEYATRVRGNDVLMTTTLDGKIKTRLLSISSGADMREPAWGPFGR